MNSIDCKKCGRHPKKGVIIVALDDGIYCDLCASKKATDERTHIAISLAKTMNEQLRDEG